MIVARLGEISSTNKELFMSEGGSCGLPLGGLRVSCGGDCCRPPAPSEILADMVGVGDILFVLKDEKVGVDAGRVSDENKVRCVGG